MINIHEVENWFVTHFGKLPGEVKADLDAAKARVEALEKLAQSHAGQAEAVVAAVEKIADTVDPAAAPEVAAAVALAREAVTEGKRLLDEVLAKV